MALRTATAFACALFVCAATATAAPHIPKDGSTVVERLPRRLDPAQRELATLRAQLAASPKDLALATRVAQRYIATARSETDPRYYGYAQAALAPWWAEPDPPKEVRLLRATLLQSTHHFPEALRDLDAIVAADPQNPQAWLTRATVHTVRGDYPAATASCAKLSPITSELVTISCIASVGGMTGRAAKSEALLELVLSRNSDADPELQSWVLTLLGEMAERRGDPAKAEQRYKRALAISPKDSYLIGAYADLLLDQRRPADVLALVRGQERIDALLLRQAMALRQMGDTAALKNADAELGARFAAAMQRGDTVHQREQARYELHVRGDAQRALGLAQKNWEVQKESADMRVLLEAALASGQRAAATPVADWVTRHGVEDVALARLLSQLKPQQKAGA